MFTARLPLGQPRRCYATSIRYRGRATAMHAPYEARARAFAARQSITMNPSPPVFEIHGDDVTVEASYLAARFGLPVDRLRAEMRRGARTRGGYA